MVNKNSRLDWFGHISFFFLSQRRRLRGRVFDKFSYDTMFEWEAINLLVWHLVMDKIYDLSIEGINTVSIADPKSSCKIV